MLWIYVLLFTVGVVIGVPTVLRAADGQVGEVLPGFIAFVGFFAGAVGLFCRQIGLNGLVTFIAAGAVGLAAGALHPELLAALRRSAAVTATEKKAELTHDER